MSPFHSPAEVDLLTDFSPGDNFRVAALSADGLKELKAALAAGGPPNYSVLQSTTVKSAAHPNGSLVKTKYFVGPTGTPGGPAVFSPQLTIWRYLNIENDNPAGIADTTYLTAGTTNRQQNRYADAYIEPRYDVPAPAQPVPPADATDLISAVSGNNPRRTTTGTSEFWVVYLTTAYNGTPAKTPSGQTAIPAGVTPNAKGDPPYQFNGNLAFKASFIFIDGLNALYNNAADVAKAAAKTAVHEIGHQLLKPGGAGADPRGHRGTDHDTGGDIQIDKYLNALNGVTKTHALNTPAKVLSFIASWSKRGVNIMNQEANRVPLDNPNLGPFDLFYFSPVDVAKLRRIVNPDD
jgi:hypothetical protein